MAWYIYQGNCPECGAEILRHRKRRFLFCSKCGVFLEVPSYFEEEKKISVHLIQFQEGGDWRKTTRRELLYLFRVVCAVAGKEENMAEEEQKDPCPVCEIGKIKRSVFQGDNKWEACSFCGNKLSVSGDPTKKITDVLSRFGYGVRVPESARSPLLPAGR